MSAKPMAIAGQKVVVTATPPTAAPDAVRPAPAIKPGPPAVLAIWTIKGPKLDIRPYEAKLAVSTRNASVTAAFPRFAAIYATISFECLLWISSKFSNSLIMCAFSLSWFEDNLCCSARNDLTTES
eukprot:gnl/MRDRNA2_/MRDRNA2_336768_c0_seq1.p1 gnl/MRDRNA2_/MRDRNA2_336768_c0~~gnl/MRDRNA2_/MRDRNA2_336768_c0_seq1.p1  ORF type:complete len:126 (+),score=15.49 gnl/MRDRNA2_/MRDRNA2_336768_c0_seq1:12-389(+)